MSGNTTSLPVPELRIVVVGTSSGGSEALAKLAEALPESLDACVFIVRHLSPESSASYIVSQLRKHTKLPCHEARDGALLQPGHICVAPADNHLLIDDSKVWVVHGPRENRWRPSIDALFRSAAVAHRNRVIGVVLSGSLDDGTAGLLAIKRCGGICIVQDPDDAAFPDMPRNALSNVAVDHCVPLAHIGGLIGKMVGKQSASAPAVPTDLLVEARIALSALSEMGTVETIGERTALTCPDCGGVLWEVNGGGFSRFRCHTGHAYSPDQLLCAQSVRIEETLWRALRMFEERKNLLKTMISGGRFITASTSEQLSQAEEDIRRLRTMLQNEIPIRTR